MDCHVFRRLCDELAPALMGCRIEKIHRPAKDVTLFTLYGTGGKRFLFLRAGRKAPFLFLSTHKIPVGSAPPADIMRLRKYLADRRIIDVLPDWVGRRLYLHVNADTECWLTLDLREGPSLLFDAPPEPEIPAWPDPAHWAEACEGDGWRDWPVITPPLRRTLPLLPPDEQAALLLDLEAGGGDLFLYENAAGERELSAWPLPPERRRDADGTPREELVVEDAIRACAAAGEAQVLRGIAALSRAEAAKPHQAEANRLRKLLLKLESEKKRLSDMVAAQDAARLLQSQLYRFSAEEKHASVTLDGAGGPVDLALDPRLTVRENMASLFHKASRGKRGISMLEGRFAAVQADLARAEQAGLMAQAATSAPTPANAPSPAAPQFRAPELPKNVQPFRSSDGFLLPPGPRRRERPASQAGSPARSLDAYRRWAGRAHPGSADHAAQEIPSRTISEAAILSVLKSWRKDETQVDVIAALAKFVHPIRGAKPGTVRIDRMEPAIIVTPDPSLEEKNWRCKENRGKGGRNFLRKFLLLTPFPLLFKDFHPYRIRYPDSAAHDRYGFESFLAEESSAIDKKARLHTKAGLSSSAQSETGIQ